MPTGTLCTVIIFGMNSTNYSISIYSRPQQQHLTGKLTPPPPATTTTTPLSNTQSDPATPARPSCSAPPRSRPAVPPSGPTPRRRQAAEDHMTVTVFDRHERRHTRRERERARATGCFASWGSFAHSVWCERRRAEPTTISCWRTCSCVTPTPTGAAALKPASALLE